jgi:hypothetical protein
MVRFWIPKGAGKEIREADIFYCEYKIVKELGRVLKWRLVG